MRHRGHLPLPFPLPFPILLALLFGSASPSVPFLGGGCGGPAPASAFSAPGGMAADGGGCGGLGRRIFVGSLTPRGCDRDELRREFSAYGPVLDVTLHGLWKRSADGEEAGSGGREETDAEEGGGMLEADGGTTATATATATDGGGAGRKRRRAPKVRPYAFVAFEEEEAAARAVAACASGEEGVRPAPGGSRSPAPPAPNLPPALAALCGAVRPATAVRPRERSNARRGRARDRSALASRLASGATAVLQGPRSHLPRLAGYLATPTPEGTALDPPPLGIDHPLPPCDVLGELHPGRKSVGLLFVRTEEPGRLAGSLPAIPYLANAVSKAYAVGGGPVRARDLEEVATEALRRLGDLLPPKAGGEGGKGGKGERVVVRVQAFPPGLRPGLIGAMDAQWNEEELEGADLSPSGFTHTLSVVEVERAEDEEREGGDGGGRTGTYLMGLAEALPTDALPPEERARSRLPNGGAGGGTDVCRAYYKLQEALLRYPHYASGSGPLAGKVALDCGAAPGGWTRYLAEEAGCGTVHGIDPGRIDPAVLALGGVRHWPMTVGEALPLLAEENVTVDVWVSDMCLHDVGEQVGWLLRAREAGVLARGAMFVLTLKCNIGHSRESHDSQARREVERLGGMATKVETMHLFSNRSGERTVVGFLT